jgi:hypothetical protein
VRPPWTPCASVSPSVKHLMGGGEERHELSQRLCAGHDPHIFPAQLQLRDSSHSWLLSWEQGAPSPADRGLHSHCSMQWDDACT